MEEAPQLAFASDAEWAAWLEEHHRDAGVWVKIAKKASGIDSVRYPEVLETALCFGWIDGRRRALDDAYFLQYFTPRRARSPWSQINRDTAERLIAGGGMRPPGARGERLSAGGRMRPRGLAEGERARADGRWEAAYASQRVIGVPEDLQREL